MKLGDKFPVNIGQGEVAVAEVREINEKDSTVTLVIPPTRVVMSYTTQLETQSVPVNTGNEHVVLGVEEVTPGNPPVPVGEQTATPQAADQQAVEQVTQSATPDAAPVEVEAPSAVAEPHAEPADPAGASPGAKPTDTQDA